MTEISFQKKAEDYLKLCYQELNKEHLFDNRWIEVKEFIKKTGRTIGGIQIRLPKIRLPKLGLGGKSSGRGCTRCSRKFQRTRG